MHAQSIFIYIYIKIHGSQNYSTLVFNKYRVIFDPPLDGVGLNF
jgi:hypothetical protein